MIDKSSNCPLNHSVSIDLNITPLVQETVIGFLVPCHNSRTCLWLFETIYCTQYTPPEISFPERKRSVVKYHSKRAPIHCSLLHPYMAYCSDYIPSTLPPVSLSLFVSPHDQSCGGRCLLLWGEIALRATTSCQSAHATPAIAGHANSQ